MRLLRDDLGHPVAESRRIAWRTNQHACFNMTDRLSRPVQVALFSASFVAFLVCAIVIPVLCVAGESGERTSAILNIRWIIVIEIGLVGAALLAAHGACEAYTGTRRRRICLDAGLCPACLYDLRSLDEEGHGVVRCPECGATWSWTEPAKGPDW